MFKCKWTLLINVTLQARRVRTGCQSCLFKFKTAMWVVAIAAFHGAFQYLVMERHIELVLNFRVTAQAQLRVAGFEQFKSRDSRLEFVM